MKNKSTPPPVLICLFVALVFAVSSSPAQADSTDWTGAVSADWFAGPSPSPSPGSPGNWTNGVPRCATDVFINNGGKAEINIPTAGALSVTLGENAPGGGAPQSGTLVVDGTTYGTLIVLPNGECEVPEGARTIYVGKGGTGTLDIIHGGRVSCRDGYIAKEEGSHGTVTLEGATPYPPFWPPRAQLGNHGPAFHRRIRYQQYRRDGDPECHQWRKRDRPQ